MLSIRKGKKWKKMSLRTGYRQVALPMQLVDDIKDFTDSNPNLGYKSTPEFIREAIRFYLRELKDQPE